MADTHDDPNAAPMRQEVRFDFPPMVVALCGLLGVAAIAVGVVLGVVLVNN